MGSRWRAEADTAALKGCPCLASVAASPALPRDHSSKKVCQSMVLPLISIADLLICIPSLDHLRTLAPWKREVVITDAVLLTTEPEPLKNTCKLSCCSEPCYDAPLLTPPPHTSRLLLSGSKRRAHWPHPPSGC